MNRQRTSTRRVGIEVEFAGIEIERAVEVVANKLCAETTRLTDYEFEIRADAYEEPFRMEVDFELLKTIGQTGGADLLTKATASVLEQAARLWMPLELISPPLDLGEMDAFEQLVRSLEAAGAVGTQDSFAYAFGAQFNPSLDDLSVDVILAHTRAFVCLTDWLIDRDRIDLTRRLTSFAQRYGEDYERLILPRAYEPELSVFMVDYLTHNATRNRALDLLPLFCFIDERQVREVVDDPRIKARPTFHYRLPSSRIGEPGWSILKPWRDWLVVERLASDPARLANLCARRLAHLAQLSLNRNAEEWLKTCARAVEGL